MEHKVKCQACKDRGWILAKSDEHGLRIEKCDTCGRFDNDDQAAAAAWPVLSKAVEAGEEFPINETDNESRKRSPQVIISVSGGVADVICKPIGVAISIFDYDVDGGEKVSKDPDGERCVISNWASQEKVISNERWPIIRQAKHDVTCHCTKQWKCPSCGNIIKCSYEQIVQIGTPHCPQCEIEMTMI